MESFQGSSTEAVNTRCSMQLPLTTRCACLVQPAAARLRGRRRDFCSIGLWTSEDQVSPAQISKYLTALCVPGFKMLGVDVWVRTEVLRGLCSQIWFWQWAKLSACPQTPASNTISGCCQPAGERIRGFCLSSSQ